MKLSIAVKLTFCCAVFCISLASRADNERTQPLPNIACRYEMSIIPHDKSQAPTTKAWFFWRTANSVQTQDADGDHGELWLRTVTGNIQYRKLYHSDKTAVEYMPADNAANNISFDWLKLSNMLSQQELDALKTVEKSRILNRNAERRTGKVNGQSIEVQWLPDEQLPANIIRKDENRTVTLRLVEISSLSAAPRKPVAIEDIANYRHIDAVDFGDMENDPFVKKVMAADGHHHH